VFHGKSLKYEVAEWKALQELDICTMTFQFRNLKDHAKESAHMKEKIVVPDYWIVDGGDFNLDNMFPNCEFWMSKIGFKLLDKLMNMQDKKLLPEREPLHTFSSQVGHQFHHLSTYNINLTIVNPTTGVSTFRNIMFRRRSLLLLRKRESM
jgi:hypothetical protein